MTQHLRTIEQGEPAISAADGARAGSRCTRFVDDATRREAWARLGEARALLVEVEVGAAARGRLADAIDDAIERELDARGAAPPGIGATSDADAALSDQLFRARRVGASGIALAVGPMRAATNALAAIEPEDCATLAFWNAATRDRPVWLFLDARDAATGAYAEPIALASLLGAGDDAPPREVAPRENVEDTGGAESVDRLEAEGDATIDEEAEATPAPTESAPIEPTPTEVIRVAVNVVVPAPPAPSAPIATEEASPKVAPAAQPPAPRPYDEWRSWALALSAARGPQPLAAFEKLFAHDYLPLANAVWAGLDDARALAAVDDFRRTFARAYADACPTFAVTGKRPRMVLDAPEVAAKIARLHGARATQILLVDGMRLDVGARIRDHVRGQLGSRASLTDDLILWSALPTTTGRQLETLGRGIEALRLGPSDADRDAEPLRGRTADVIRRVRVGSRDLYKLDAVEARVRENGTDAFASLPFVAEAAGDAIVRHAATLQPRTLLFVFGDHGFTFDRDGAARQGGASPEEVLVPAFALLLGDVH